MVYIVVAALATIIVLAVIAAICFIVGKFTNGEGSKNTPGKGESGTGKAGETDGLDQTAPKQRVEMNLIHFGGSGPYPVRPLIGSVSSDHSVIPS